MMSSEATPLNRTAIVGQGVIGLTSVAWLLARGYTVNVFSREPFEATTPV